MDSKADVQKFELLDFYFEKVCFLDDKLKDDIVTLKEIEDWARTMKYGKLKILINTQTWTK